MSFCRKCGSPRNGTARYCTKCGAPFPAGVNTGGAPAAGRAVAISQPGSGLVSAAVTFTSHQLPSASPTGTSCTNWTIVLYLRQQSGRYLIGPAPPGYHAQYQAC
jgi:hypothetical protein